MRSAESVESAALDLSHPFARQIEDLTNLAKRFGLVILESEPIFQHLPLTLRQFPEGVGQGEQELLSQNPLVGVRHYILLEQISQLGVSLHINGLVQRQ